MYFEESVMYQAGDRGYHTHRIPALLATSSGTILAFSEARMYTGDDSDQIDLFLRRSTDGGRQFGSVQVVATADGWVSGNPAPVQDRETGTIWLLFCRNPRHEQGEQQIVLGHLARSVWVTSSTDDGLTWGEPVEITDQVKRDSWTWYATGPCHGIQLENGRLVIPCDHVDGENRDYKRSGHSHIIYSDDQGSSWRIGGMAQAGTNESVAIQTNDGSLHLNCRSYARHQNGELCYRRALAWSSDNGDSFGRFETDDTLVEPICQASMVRMTSIRTGARRDRVLFCNPTGSEGVRQIRHRLTVRLSYDECRTWPVSRVVYPGPAAYSDLCVAPDGAICCFYERQSDESESDSSEMALARFDLSWLTRGADQ